MPLTLITGRANSGKTERAYRALVDAAPDHAALLLPTAPDVVRARRDTASLRPIGVGVWQFDRYLSELWAVVGDGRALVGDVQRIALCREVTDRTGDGSHSTPGMAQALATYVRQLADTGSQISVSQGSTLSELANPSARYFAALEDRGLVEPAGAFGTLGQVENRESALVAHRFTEFTAPQEAYLLARARAGIAVTVTLTWEQGAAATDVLSDLACRLIAAADSHVVLEPGEREHGASELWRMECELFASGEPHAPDGALTLIEAHGEEAEALGVAEQAAAWLDAGLTGEEIAIVYRDPARHLPALERSLAQAGVPYDADVRVPVSQAPLGRALARLLAFAAGLGSADLAAFLRSPFAGADGDGADEHEARWRRARRVRGRELLRGLDELGPDTLGIVLDAMELRQAPLSSDSPHEWGAFLGRMLRAAHGCDAPQLSASARSDAAAYRAVIDAVTQLSTLGLDRPGGDVVYEALAWVRTRPLETERPDSVQVMPVERARSRRFKALILAGLTADEFPKARSSAGEDAVAWALSRDGVATRTENELDRERLLYYLAVTRARDHLALSRQASNGEGKPLRPSPFWEETLDLYRRPSELSGADDDTAFPSPPVRRIHLFEELGLADSGAVTGRAALRALAAGRCSDEEPGGDEAATRAAALRLQRTGLSGDALERLVARTTLSASEIEAYVRCPYAWFYDRAVGTRGLDGEFGFLERGSLAHEVLHAVYAALPERTGSARVTSETLPDVLVLADETIEAAGSGKPLTADLDEDDALRTIAARVRALLSADAGLFTGFEPTALEWSFGPEEESGLELAGVQVRGRVDRIDSDGSALLIMDYKSGNTVRHTAFERDGLVQLPLYAEAARRAFGLSLAGGLYRSLKDGGNRGFLARDAVEAPGKAAGGSIVDVGALEEVVTSGLERAAAAIEGMRAGRIDPVPAKDSICEYCAAADVCGGPR